MGFQPLLFGYALLEVGERWLARALPAGHTVSRKRNHSTLCPIRLVGSQFVPLVCLLVARYPLVARTPTEFRLGRQVLTFAECGAGLVRLDSIHLGQGPGLLTCRRAGQPEGQLSSSVAGSATPPPPARGTDGRKRVSKHRCWSIVFQNPAGPDRRGGRDGGETRAVADAPPPPRPISATTCPPKDGDGLARVSTGTARVRRRAHRSEPRGAARWLARPPI
jgi:hypothetical protein